MTATPPRTRRRDTLGSTLIAASLLWSCGNANAARAAARTSDGYRISGPYTHSNLSVFLIHGKDRLRTHNLLTLQEAIQQKKVVVHETGDVNQLAVENVSLDADIYIQSGDIVKGGRQDRMISQDFIVAPKSGRMPIGSFCVERGRWNGRAQEPVAAFGSASDQALGKALKIAARRKQDQGEVWREVAAAQAKLSESVGYVPSSLSPSSLQLTLEDDKVKQAAERYLKSLSKSAAAAEDAIGAAFAINGGLSSVEIYASRQLFERLWPKLLRAAAVEALAEHKGGAAARTLSPADVQSWLAAAEQARAEEKQLTGRVKLVTREAPANVLFETRDAERKDEWVHRSYVAK